MYIEVGKVHNLLPEGGGCFFRGHICSPISQIQSWRRYKCGDENPTSSHHFDVNMTSDFHYTKHQSKNFELRQGGF